MIFNLFKRKEAKKADIAIEIVTDMLMQQIELAYHVDNIEFDNRLNSHYGRGYIMGFCDAYLQVVKFRDNNEITMKLLYNVHTKIYGEVKASSIISQSLKDQNNNNVFEKGIIRGGQDCCESIKYNVPPIALSQYLLKGTEA